MLKIGDIIEEYKLGIELWHNRIILFYGLCTVWILMQSNIKTILIRNYKSIWRSLPVFYYLASVGQRYITLPLVYEEYHYLLFILIKVSSILFYPGGLFNVILYIRYDVSWKYKRIESSFSYDICCVVKPLRYMFTKM